MKINFYSAAFWAALAGAASLICGALGAGGIAQSVSNLLIAVGGLVIAVSAHPVITAQQAKYLAAGRTAKK